MSVSEEIKVSVVIPVYNVERHIERCVRSLMCQTLDEVEYLFIDDCSTDNSIATLESVLQQYPDNRHKVKIIRHDSNRGVGAARQTAFDAARGEYIASCDSDDFVTPDFCQKLYEKARETDADIVVSDYIIDFGNRTATIHTPMPSDPIECIDLTLRGKQVFSFWNKLLRRRLIENAGRALEPDLDMWEDVVAMARLYLKSQRVAYVDSPIYHYNVRSDSYSLTLNTRSLRQMARSLDLAAEAFDNAGVARQLEKPLNLTRIGLKYNMLLNSRGVEQRQWLRYHREADRYALSYTALPPLRRLHLWLGVNGLLPLFNMVANIRQRKRKKS